MAAQVADVVLSGTLSRLAYLAEVRVMIPTQERAWIIVADAELRSLLAAGDLTTAQQLMTQIHTHIKTRAEQDPTNTQWRRDLVVSHHRLGDLAEAVGDIGTAAEHFQNAQAINLRLVEQDPTNTEWQRDLAVSHNRLGDLAKEAGTTEGAISE